MSKIEANKGVITQINVFTVEPGKAQALIDVLVEGADSVKNVPGWLSANIHLSLDGTRVVNYAQCESYEAWEAVMEKLRARKQFVRNKEFGESHPGPYEVVYTLEK